MHDTTVAADLSPRERDVLKLLARGLSNSEISERIFLSEGTVRNYVSSILTKLGVTDRTQAAVIALRHGRTGLGLADLLLGKPYSGGARVSQDALEFCGSFGGAVSGKVRLPAYINCI